MTTAARPGGDTPWRVQAGSNAGRLTVGTRAASACGAAQNSLADFSTARDASTDVIITETCRDIRLTSFRTAQLIDLGCQCRSLPSTDRRAEVRSPRKWWRPSGWRGPGGGRYRAGWPDGEGVGFAEGCDVMRIVRWWAGTKHTKLHVSADGIKTACGALVPERATVTRETPTWWEHTTCYNCCYRLWPTHGPQGYLQPTNGRDFPIRRACSHRRDPRYCLTCDGSLIRPCPNCGNRHDPMYSIPPCAVTPEGLRERFGPPGPRCADGCCLSEDRARHAYNPKLSLDLADSAMSYCYRCGLPVCISCQATPVPDDGGPLQFCARCDAEIATYEPDIALMQ